MPSQYNIPAASQLWNSQQIDLYNKLPFYLALQDAKFYPEWMFWNKLIGTIPWQPNMGNTLKGVVVEPSPIQRAFISPAALTSPAKKDIISQLERTNTAVLYHHKFESPQFNFMPSFADFRKKQIGTAQKDLQRQVAAADDIFARGMFFHGSPYMFISGKAKDANGNFELIPAPYGIPSDDATTGKSTNFLQEAVSLIGNNKGNLSLKVINKCLQIISNDIQAPAFEGMVNVPKDNETIKGNYVMVGSEEAYAMLTFDDHVLSYKPLDMNVLNEEFSGKLFGRVVYKAERFPIRVAADGTVPPPQLYVGGDADTFNLYETVPNPDWVNAPFEVAHIMGAGTWDKITVGPPPAEFAGGKISESKFNKLFWNGETKITDDILIQVGTDSNGNPILDTNKYGEFLQLISHLTMGMIAVNRRFGFPILYRRWRVPTN